MNYSDTIHDQIAEILSTTRPISSGSKPDLYLKSRGIRMEKYPVDLRMDDKQNMIAVIRDPIYGIGVSYQETKLDENCNKVFRKNAAGIQIPDGCAVRLAKPEKVMGIAEGTETALSVSRLSSVPVWSTCGSTNLEKWIPPNGVKGVYIFADNDLNLSGKKSAEILRQRLEARGLKVEVTAPKQLGDWNDYVMEKRWLTMNKKNENVLSL